MINVSMDIVTNDQPEGSSADWPKSSDDFRTTDYDVTEDEGVIGGGVGMKDDVIAKPQRKKKKRQQLLSKLDKLSADKRVALTGIFKLFFRVDFGSEVFLNYPLIIMSI